MLRGLYSASTSLDAMVRNQEVVATNLANSNMPGYRRRVASIGEFGSTLTRLTPDNATAARPTNRQPNSPNSREAERLNQQFGRVEGVQVTGVHTIHEQGALTYTGHTYDVGIQGNAFFTVQGPTGPLYTRTGVFQLNNQGELQTANGFRVLGPIAIPPTARDVVIREDGSVSADGATVGQLQLAEFADPNLLTPVGNTFFEAPPGVRSTNGNSTVHQYYRESSNVQVVDELVTMLTGMRHYEAAQRAIKSISEAIQLSTRPQGA